MILYLTSKIYMNILDFLKDEEEVLIKKYVGEFSLKEFLGKSIQRLGHIETIVIDRTCLSDNDEQIIEAIKIFKSFSKIKIVFYIMDKEQSLVHELIGLGIFNIITENEVEELRKEIRICLFEDMSDRYIKRKIGLLCDEVKEVPFDFKEKQITIGVVGSQHRVGTTTIAMQFACYLNSIGAKVSYVEANDSGHLKLIAKHYSMQTKGDGYVYKGIIFKSVNSKNEILFDFIVYDLGVLNNKTLRGFVNCNIKVLCAGTKPQEIYFYYNCAIILNKKDRINVIVSTPIQEKNFYRAEISEDVLSNKINQEIYEKVLIETLKVNEPDL